MTVQALAPHEQALSLDRRQAQIRPIAKILAAPVTQVISAFPDAKRVEGHGWFRGDSALADGPSARG
jgi:hypothetical protein